MSDLFAGISVSKFTQSNKWYELFLGRKADFYPNEIEAVWKLDEHQYIYIVEKPEFAGNSILMHMVDDLELCISAIAVQGIEPIKTERFPNNISKVTYSDPDGNLFSFGGVVKNGGIQFT